MIIACPHCGHDLDFPLKDGISSCEHCHQVFDTSPFNRILSACRYVRKHNIADLSRLEHHGLDEVDSLIALALAYDGDFSHDEIVKILKRLGVSQKFQM